MDMEKLIRIFLFAAIFFNDTMVLLLGFNIGFKKGFKKAKEIDDKIFDELQKERSKSNGNV